MRNWCVIFSTIFFFGCLNSENIQKTKPFLIKEINGNTQGTTYRIVSADKHLNCTKKEIDSILLCFDLELSGYNQKSMLSNFNQNIPIDFENSNYFKYCFNKSKEIYENSHGCFDPTVYPLVEAWGFFNDTAIIPNQNHINNLLQNIGFDSNTFELFGDSIIKIKSKTKFDFNAIAQGYSVDVLADFLNYKGNHNYYIEIGGEIFVKGKNREQSKWKIGIDNPIENSNSATREIENIIQLSDIAIATSGNYRRFYIKNGKKYSHTINPKTGYPVEHNLLSVTVIAPHCADADAYATVFMVLGYEESIKFINDNPHLNLEAYFLFENESKRIERIYSKGMDNFLLN